MNKMKLQLLVLSTFALSSMARAESESDAIWTAVDLAGINTKIVALGVIAVGIAITWASIRLGRKGVNQVK